MAPKVVTVCYPWIRSPKGNGSDGFVDTIVLGKKSDTDGARALKMVGKWNGGGGKMKPGIDRTIAHCAQRETEEDFGIIPVLDRIVEAGIVLFERGGELTECHFSFVDLWTGDFVEKSREMDVVRKFDVRSLPYEEMMDADRRYRLPFFFHVALMRGQVFRLAMSLDDDMKVVSAGNPTFHRREAVAS